MNSLPQRAASLLGERVVRTNRLHGGDLSEVHLLHLASGATAVAKTGPRAAAEARMLAAIRDAGAPAPRVLGVGQDLLLIEALEDRGGPASAWPDLGRVLRELHARIGPHYGWPEDHAFGPVVIANQPSDHWPSFWAEHRLLSGLEELPTEIARRLEALAARLGERLPARPAASLLHGDLWSGNILGTSGRITGLIDPACYHGHAEVDLAMLALFGAPGDAFWEGYGAVEPDLARRRPIYQLWPAQVHLRLFGSGYRGLVERLLREAG